MIPNIQNLDKTLHYFEILLQSWAVFYQKIGDFCSLTNAISGIICHFIVSRGLKELPDWLYPYKKCKFLAKISKSYFKIMLPLFNYFINQKRLHLPYLYDVRIFKTILPGRDSSLYGPL